MQSKMLTVTVGVEVSQCLILFYYVYCLAIKINFSLFVLFILHGKSYYVFMDIF